MVVDVAIRGGALADSGLMSRRLGGFRYVICASPAYVEERGEPKTVASLAEHALIRYRRPGSDALQGLMLSVPVPSEATLGPPAMTCTNMEAVLAATVAGLGLACMPDFLAADALKTGELILLLSDASSAGEFWLVWPGGRGSSPKLRAFINFVTGHVLAESD
jgi:DNA-binding transcriptional LysR family regulator